MLGLGANVGLRRYLHAGGGQRGLYVGGFLEWAYLNTRDEVDDQAEYFRHLIIPAGELGYRWVQGNFLLDIGILVGSALPVIVEDNPIGSMGCRYESSCDEDSEPYPFGLVVVDIGVFV